MSEDWKEIVGKVDPDAVKQIEDLKRQVEGLASDKVTFEGKEAQKEEIASSDLPEVPKPSEDLKKQINAFAVETGRFPLPEDLPGTGRPTSLNDVPSPPPGSVFADILGDAQKEQESVSDSVRRSRTARREYRERFKEGAPHSMRDDQGIKAIASDIAAEKRARCFLRGHELEFVRLHAYLRCGWCGARADIEGLKITEGDG